MFVLRKLEKSSKTACCKLLLVGFLAALKKCFDLRKRKYNAGLDFARRDWLNLLAN